MTRTHRRVLAASSSRGAGKARNSRNSPGQALSFPARRRREGRRSQAPRHPVQAFASGETGAPAVGILAACPRRLAYPNASFTLSEPRLWFGGTVTAVTAREQQAKRMTDSL